MLSTAPTFNFFNTSPSTPFVSSPNNHLKRKALSEDIKQSPKKKSRNINAFLRMALNSNVAEKPNALKRSRDSTNYSSEDSNSSHSFSTSSPTTPNSAQGDDDDDLLFVDHKKRRIMHVLERSFKTTTIQSTSPCSPLSSATSPSSSSAATSGASSNSSNNFFLRTPLYNFPAATSPAAQPDEQDISALATCLNATWIDSFNMCDCIQTFEKYVSSPESNYIQSWGLQRLLQDIGFTSFFETRYFLLVYLFGCRSKFQITRTEWSFGMFKLQCDTVQKLSQRLAEAEREVASWNTEHLKKFATFCFKFMKDSPQSRSVDRSIVSKMLKCIFKQSPFTLRFMLFLESDDRHKCVNLDQWKIFVDFSATIKHDFSNYDAGDAWPTIYDHFTDFCFARGLRYVQDPREVTNSNTTSTSTDAVSSSSIISTQMEVE